MSEIGTATLLFHHECKILRIFPIVSLYFVPAPNSPLVHLHATFLSPHSCTVDPSSRMCTVMSSGPSSLGVFSFSFFPLSLFFWSVFCWLHFIQYVADELKLFFWRVLLLSRNYPVFLARPIWEAARKVIEDVGARDFVELRRLASRRNL